MGRSARDRRTLRDTPSAEQARNSPLDPFPERLHRSCSLPILRLGGRSLICFHISFKQWCEKGFMLDYQDLKRELSRIDGRGYKSYQDLRGKYAFPDFFLYIDHVQGDPFAAPSRLRVRVPQDEAGYPAETFASRSRRLALCTYLAKQFAAAALRSGTRRGSGRSGLIEMVDPAQEIMERSCVDVTSDHVEARFLLGLPAAGRRILGGLADRMLCEDLPAIVRATLFFRRNDPAAVERYLTASEDADHLRARLTSLGLVAFVARDSILPRRSGVDDRPLRGPRVVPFEVPAHLRVEVDLPNAGRTEGMGIEAGVTLIVGGGYHGKSTLLNAIERGVYNHIPGDGRELVVTRESAVKIRAESGRSVAGVDISPFINGLPHGRDTRCFSTGNASGSTSQAANIAEAMEAGAEVLLIDEDTAATNFMIRDRRMQLLIAGDKEPITPFIDRVRPLWEQHGISSIVVIGGSGDYFDVADTVILVEDYVPRNVTGEARSIAARDTTRRRPEGSAVCAAPVPRIPLPRSIDPSKGRRQTNVKAKGRRTIVFGGETIDLSAVEQLVDPGQTRALAAALVHARENHVDGKRSVRQVLDLVEKDIEGGGLDILSRFPEGGHVRFRRFELAAALNRLRSLMVRQE